MSLPAEGYFFSIEAKEHIVLMPWYIGSIKKGIHEQLNPRILEYSPKLRGILVSYSDVTILQNAAAIHDDSPQVHFYIKYRACVFQPPVGAVFTAVVNKVGEDYLTCLAHGCFNVLVSLEGESDSLTVYSDITEGQEVLVRVTKLPIVGDHVTLIGELYVEKARNAVKQTSKDDSAVKRKRRKRCVEDEPIPNAAGEIDNETLASGNCDETVVTTSGLNGSKKVRRSSIETNKNETVRKNQKKKKKKKHKKV